ncbi:hypothetical protein LTR37_004164 [Vermiconidia calcicola]|uniref:Uncharacterized protein n=1 Tax=Vermiconidia calcicola TaxID=1690605 RepID=A0ACC3NML3_9PEZI|nr:hypothetical protein LTR37_004164 [Vermiconidia calcicola]
MDSIAKRVGSLLIDPKYSDLEICCDGRTYLVHRAIVCSRSEVLAKECDDGLELTKLLKDSDEGIVQHTLFDALTLERLLQFIYQGDYTAKATIPAAAAEEQSDGCVGGAVKAPQSLPPHLRNRPAVQHRHGASSQRCQILATSPLTAHVYVFAIAEHYGLPELEALALQKFKAARATVQELTETDFFTLAEAVFANTKDTKDELRKELLSIVVNDHKDWLHKESFTRALTSDTALNELSVAIVTAIFEQMKARESQIQADAASQAAANSLLLSDLDQANEGLARSSKRTKVLEQQLAKAHGETQKAKAENFRLEGEVMKSRMEKDSRDASNNLLVSDLDQANEGLARSTSRVKELEGQLHADAMKAKSEVARLEKDLEAFREYGSKVCKTAETNSKIATEKATQLKKETDRANLNYRSCNEKDARNSATTADLIAEKAETSRAISIIRSQVSLVNSTEECRHCGESLDFRLEQDDRSGGYPYNAMLRCCCRTKEYGSWIP